MQFSYKFFILSLFTLTASTIVMAHPPNNTSILFQCPVTSCTGPNNLSNFGTYIGGNGYEIVNGNQENILTPEFDGPIISGSNIPSSICNGSYVNANTSYSPSTGIVTCSYTSDKGFDPFTVGYKMTNGYGGTVKQSSNCEILISLSVGFKSSKPAV